MNAFIQSLRPTAIFPGRHSRLHPLVTGTYANLRGVRRRDPADGLVMNASPLVADKPGTRSKLNATMAVTLTARQFASRRGSPPICAMAGPIDAKPVGERQ